MKSKVPTPDQEQGLAESLESVRANETLLQHTPRVNPARQQLHSTAARFLPANVAGRVAAAVDEPALAASAVRTVVIWRQNVYGTENQRRAFVAVVAELLKLHTCRLAPERWCA